MISNWRVLCYLYTFLVFLFICSEKNVCLSMHKQCVLALILFSKGECIGYSFLTSIYFLRDVCTSLPHEMHPSLPIFSLHPSTYMDMLGSHLIVSYFQLYYRRSLTLVPRDAISDALRAIYPQGP